MSGFYTYSIVGNVNACTYSGPNHTVIIVHIPVSNLNLNHSLYKDLVHLNNAIMYVLSAVGSQVNSAVYCIL